MSSNKINNLFKIISGHHDFKIKYTTDWDIKEEYINRYRKLKSVYTNMIHDESLKWLVNLIFNPEEYIYKIIENDYED